MAFPVAHGDAVAPRGAGMRGRGAGRLAASAAALLAFAAALALVVSGGGGGSSLGQVGSEGASEGHAPSRLAFGDGSFQPSGSSSARERSVRGQRPDFKPPIGSLGSTELEHAGAAGSERQQLSLEAARKHPQLAFGDASGFKASSNPEDKEGGVRGGVRPDFKPPVGDLGKVGLAKGEKQQPAQALAFGDAHFTPSDDTGKREGSVRGGKRPDFKPPMGSLGETGLAQKKKDKQMSSIAAREEVDRYYDEQAAAIERLANKASPPLVTSVVAHSQLGDFYDKLQGKAQAEHAHVISEQMAHERSSAGDMNSYFDDINKKDTKMHQAALQREHDEDKAMLRLEANEATHFAAQHKTKAHSSHPAPSPSAPASTSAKQAGVSALRATTEALAGAEEGIFDAPKGNKHGFHAPQVSRDVGVRQQLKAARDIAKNDLNDCAFTLC